MCFVRPNNMSCYGADRPPAVDLSDSQTARSGLRHTGRVGRHLETRGPEGAFERTARGGLLLLAAAAVLGLGRQGSGSGSALPIVRGHASDYVIYYDRRAAPSVAEAAVDLRDYIARATGATLPIVNATGAPAAPFIGLGDTAESRKAGITLDRMPPDAFVIAPRGRNVFIVGPDTGTGQRLDSGGTSAGTANGVYTFLERYVDVRWLMPGDAGADVPKRTDVLVPAVDVREAPAFAYRRVPYMQNDNAAVAQWSRRQKLGYSLALNHSHNWEVIGPELFDAHPDWFAASNGQRLKPGDRYKARNHQSCTRRGIRGEGHRGVPP